MTPGTVSIHLISPEPLPTQAGWPLLSPAERVRAASFVFPKHASHWIACRAALRRILGGIIHVPPAEVPLVVSKLGKPELAVPFDYLHFSLSHCENLALLALSVDGPVGVDVEASRRATELPDCETAFCHPAEIDALPVDSSARGECLLDIWTAKEAVLKALGTGFSHPPETVCIHGNAATSDEPLPGIEDQVIHRLDHPALSTHCAALSAASSATRIEIHPFEAST
jgi:4'-phosphopantetheinyl transferase